MFASVTSAASKAPKLFLNGLELQSASAPRIDKSTTFIPIRTVAEGMGFDVTWDKAAKKAVIHNGDSLIELVVGSKSSVVNGSKIVLATPAKIVGSGAASTTMVPLRFVSENMGLEVYYDAPAKSVYLFQPSTQEPTAPGTDGGTGQPGTGGTGSQPDPGTGGTTPGDGDGGSSGGGTIPADAQALVTSIQYDGIGTTSIAYQGIATVGEPQVLSGPDRIVLDIPAAAFADAFTPGYSATTAKMGEIVTDNSLVTKIRFSHYSDKPSTVRVVWDLQAAAQYTLTKSEGLLQLSVLGASEPVPPVPTTPSGDKIFKVVIDAGHGDQDPGAIGITGKTEKSFNLAIALKVNELLKKEARIEPILTRSDDTFIPLEERAAIANRLNADVFISIHANALKGSSASGTETYYNRADSKTLADIIQKHLLAATGLPNRKVQTAGFVVIKKTTMPAVLTESGFLTNSKDNAILFDENKQNEIAQALVRGIKEYLKL
ncbi:AMIN domain-containing protein [Paenibacillus albicereus]|uniref:AMIN domain-containing protein n=1 Tax=Paenibacillus albicereus TaxID=2726185 RepID=A0A6H2GX12_9BACL|nr:N-acetylmuramoyl-L-alanine amidase [Paenibacillus albicereus]QJC51937.1 AMIN domain-containing protein [Paenibacillus albicereus]